MLPSVTDVDRWAFADRTVLAFLPSASAIIRCDSISVLSLGSFMLVVFSSDWRVNDLNLLHARQPPQLNWRSCCLSLATGEPLPDY